MKKYFLLIACVLFAMSSQGQTLTVKESKAMVNGKTSMASYTGASDALEGTLNLATGEANFKIPLETVKTGNGSTDKVLYKVVEIEMVPCAAFKCRVAG